MKFLGVFGIVVAKWNRVPSGVPSGVVSAANVVVDDKKRRQVRP